MALKVESRKETDARPRRTAFLAAGSHRAVRFRRADGCLAAVRPAVSFRFVMNAGSNRTRATPQFDTRRFEICILAGGRSSRMGRDKSRLRLGGRTLLAHIRQAARASGLPQRIIRGDVVARCGPLGGIHTALMTSRSDGVVFLACDMPFVSVGLLRMLLRRAKYHQSGLFVEADGRAGFPFILFCKTARPCVERQLAKRALSVQQLARALGAQALPLPARRAREVFNVNSPEDLARARDLWRSRGAGKG